MGSSSKKKQSATIPQMEPGEAGNHALQSSIIVFSVIQCVITNYHEPPLTAVETTVELVHKPLSSKHQVLNFELLTSILVYLVALNLISIESQTSNFSPQSPSFKP